MKNASPDSRIPVVMLAYFDEPTIRHCLEGLQPLRHRLAVTLVENNSPHSAAIRRSVAPFLSSGLVHEYLYFPENISNNAFFIALREAVSCAEHQTIIVTDGDLTPLSPNWLDEQLRVVNVHHEVFAIGGSLCLENLPLAAFPDAGGWVPPDVADRGDYFEAYTGMHFVMFRGHELAQALSFIAEAGEKFQDSVLHKYCYGRLGRRWARTKKATFRHLTWDNYANLDHPYTRMKRSKSFVDHWSHDRYSSFEFVLRNGEAIR